MRKGLFFQLGVALGFMLFASSAYSKMGLEMNNYAEVIVENLIIGQEYSMIDLVNLPLEITNSSDKDNKILIEIIAPEAAKTKKGFEPIPDSAWIEVTPLTVVIAAGQKYSTDVKIRIPNDPQYLGKKYEVNIVARVLPDEKGLIALAVGVQGRLLFTLAEQADTVANKPKGVNMNYDFTPERVVMDDVELGKAVDVVTPDKKFVIIQNFSKKRQKYLLQSVAPQDTVLRAEEGYEVCPDPNWILIAKEEISVKGKGEQPLKLKVSIPDQPEYKNKKYFFIVSVKTGSSFSGARYVKILVSTKKD